MTENTKTDGISSGLVVVAWESINSISLARTISRSQVSSAHDATLYQHTPLVRLSDAEAIISQKDAEIERWKFDLADALDMKAGKGPTVLNWQAERIKELEAEVLEQCRLNGMGAERELALLGQIERQSAALKLAREAIVAWQGSSLFEPSLSVCERKSDEALAAIDALVSEGLTHENGWRTIDTAPRNQRILVKSESGEIYAAHWVQHPMTGDEAWCVSEAPDGTQHLVHPVAWRDIGEKEQTR